MGVTQQSQERGGAAVWGSSSAGPASTPPCAGLGVEALGAAALGAAALGLVKRPLRPWRCALAQLRRCDDAPASAPQQTAWHTLRGV